MRSLGTSGMRSHRRGTSGGQRPRGYRPLVELLEDRVVLSQTPYADTILASGPAAYWRLGETSGQSALDSSGNNRHGNYYFGVVLGQPPGIGHGTDTSVAFDGINDYALFGTPLVGDNFTVEFWMRTTATSLTGTEAYQGNGLVWSDILGTANDWIISVLNDKIAFSTINHTIYGTTNVNDGQWHHVVCTRVRNGDKMIFVDGQFQSSGFSSANRLNANLTVVVGGNTLDNRYFNGGMDEVSMYNRDLSAAEVLEHYNEGRNQLPTTVPDAASGNEGTPINVFPLANDLDPDGQPVSLVSVGPAANGSVAIQNNGTPADATDDYVTYTPNAGFFGTDSFTYEIADSLGGTSFGVATVTVASVAPAVVAGGTASILEGGAFAGSGSFSDPGADTWTATVDYGDGSGVQALALNADRTFGLAHAYADNGNYTVTVTVADDDGNAGTASFAVAVANVAPDFAAVADLSGYEGHLLFALASFTDPGADTWTATVDWGDGSGPQPVLVNPNRTIGLAHSYADNGTYTVTLTVTDDDGESDATGFTAVIDNIVPVVAQLPEGTVDEGLPFTAAGSFADSGADTWTATVDYGDGSGVQPLTLNADRTFNLAHTYADDGTFIVTVTVTDDDGGAGPMSFDVVVNNVGPEVSAGGDGTADEGAAFVRGGSFTDLGSDSHTATVDYGDGSGVQALALNADKTFNLSHTYADNGTFIVTVTVTDDDGNDGSASFAVVVGNVAPTVSAGGQGTANEGATFVRSGSFSDPGADSFTATVNYGDGSGTQALTLNADGTFNLSHAFADDGTFTVTVTVTDDDGGAGSATFAVVVSNVAPKVTAQLLVIGFEGRTLSNSGSFTDPGADTWTATVDWGDGTGAQPVTLNANGTFSVSHVYADNGLYLGTLTVRDDDGGVGRAFFVAVVFNVVPYTSLSGAAATLPGGQETLSLQTADVSPDEEAGFRYEVDWGDGTVESHAATPGNGPRFDVGHRYQAHGRYTVRVFSVDKDGGVSDVSEHVVSVAGTSLQADPLAPGQEMLVVSGTDGDDRIQLLRHHDGVKVVLNGATVGVYQPTSRIVLFAGGGNDRVTADCGLRLPLWLHGGDGNDYLEGGERDDVLLGEVGDDVLVGGCGRDLLIGGAGRDTILGTCGGELAVGGTTAHDANDAALAAVLAEWGSDHSYAKRIANLSGTGTGPRKNGDFFLKADGAGATVFDDGDQDWLFGGGGLDWFFAGARPEDHVVWPQRREGV